MLPRPRWRAAVAAASAAAGGDRVLAGGGVLASCALRGLRLFAGFRRGGALVGAWAAGFAYEFRDGQVEFAAGGVDSHDDDLGDVADADFGAGALAAHVAAALVDVPPVVHQVLVAD